MCQNHPKSAKLSKIERTWSLKYDPNGTKQIIKMNQMDQNRLSECTKLKQNRENLVIEMIEMDQNQSLK